MCPSTGVGCVVCVLAQGLGVYGHSDALNGRYMTMRRLNLVNGTKIRRPVISLSTTMDICVVLRMS